MEDFNLSQCEESPDAPKIQISRSILELLSSKLHESKTENVKLKQTCEELTKKQSDSNEQTAKISTELIRHKEENVQLKDRCSKLLDREYVLGRDLGYATDEVKKLKSENTELKQKLEVTDSNRIQLQKKLVENDKENSELKRNMGIANTEYSKLRDISVKSDKENVQLKGRLCKSENEALGLSLGLSRSNSENADLKRKLSAGEYERGLLQNNVIQLSKERQEYVEQRKKLTKDLDEGNKIIEAQDAQLAKLREENKSLETRLEQEAVHLENYRTSVSSLTAQIDEKCANIKDQEVQLEKLKEENKPLDTLKAEVSTLEAILDERCANIKDQDFYIAKLEEEKGALESALNRKAAQIDEKCANIKDQEVQLEKLKEENKSLNTSKAELETQIIDLAKELPAWQQKVSHILVEVEQKRGELARLKREHNTELVKFGEEKDTHIKHLGEIIVKRQADNKRLNAEIERLSPPQARNDNESEAWIKQLSGTITDQQLEIKKLKAEIERLSSPQDKDTKREIDELNQAIADQQGEINNLRFQFEAASRCAPDNATIIIEKDKIISQLTIERNDLKKVIHLNAAIMHATDQDIINLTKTNKALEGVNYRQGETIKSQEREIVTLTAQKFTEFEVNWQHETKESTRNSQLKEQIHSQRALIVKLKHESKSQQEKLIQENSSLNTEITRLGDVMKVKLEEINKLLAQIETPKEQLSASEWINKEHSSNSEKINSLTSETNKLQERTKELETKATSVEKENLDLKAEVSKLSTVKSNWPILMEETDRLQRKCKELERKVKDTEKEKRTLMGEIAQLNTVGMNWDKFKQASQDMKIKIFSLSEDNIKLNVNLESATIKSKQTEQILRDEINRLNGVIKSKSEVSNHESHTVVQLQKESKLQREKMDQEKQILKDEIARLNGAMKFQHDQFRTKWLESDLRADKFKADAEIQKESHYMKKEACKVLATQVKHLKKKLQKSGIEKHKKIAKEFKRKNKELTREYIEMETKWCNSASACGDLVEQNDLLIKDLEACKLIIKDPKEIEFLHYKLAHMTVLYNDMQNMYMDNLKAPSWLNREIENFSKLIDKCKQVSRCSNLTTAVSYQLPSDFGSKLGLIDEVIDEMRKEFSEKMTAFNREQENNVRANMKICQLQDTIRSLERRLAEEKKPSDKKITDEEKEKLIEELNTIKGCFAQLRVGFDELIKQNVEIENRSIMVAASYDAEKKWLVEECRMLREGTEELVRQKAELKKQIRKPANSDLIIDDEKKGLISECKRIREAFVQLQISFDKLMEEKTRLEKNVVDSEEIISALQTSLIGMEDKPFGRSTSPFDAPNQAGGIKSNIVFTPKNQ